MKEPKIRPLYHAAASAGAAAGLFAVHPDPVCAAAVFLSGTLVDADHLIDLWVYRKHRRPGEKLLQVIESQSWVYNFIPLHALELLPLLAAMIFVAADPWLWGGILLGFGLHLFMDILGNRAFPLTYFLAYRILCGFDSQSLWMDSRPRSVDPRGGS